MKYYIIAGEASGDLHGSNLIKEIHKKDPQASVRAWGGDLMEKAGAHLVKHYRDLAFMGFLEVLLNLGTILKNIKKCKSDILDFKPDILIFIDYPGFNMRIARWAKAQGIRTHYYIAPQVWAWKENRVKAIKRDVDKMSVILPFEKQFFEEKHQFPVHFVGHPLLDAVEAFQAGSEEDFRNSNGLDPKKPINALLPGSRKQEIRKMLTVMLQSAKKFSNYQFVIAGAPGQEEAFYKPFLSNDINVFWVYNQTYKLLSFSYAALVTSGTATLETALFEVPQVVCYKGNGVSYQIAKRIVNLDYISLVNLVLEKEVVTELIQSDCHANRVTQELEAILHSKKRSFVLSQYILLKTQLGGKGASQRVAEAIINQLS